MSTLIGILLATILILVGMIMKGGSIAGIINIPAFLMVVGGTMGVLIASFGMKPALGMFKLFLGQAIKERPERRPELVNELVGLSEKARREGLLVLEEDAKRLDDPFLGKGVRLVVDGTDPELVKDVLETELDAMEERHRFNQDIFKQGGAFAPTIGILATVLSLVGVLQHLDDPDSLGPSISAAFLATFYGVFAANIVFMPIANALKKKTALEVGERMLIIEGVLSIQNGDNPRVLADKLWSFSARAPGPGGRRGRRRRRAGRCRRRRRTGLMGKRKEHHEEHPDERWLVTYADVLTLMYVLFMVLFSISIVNTSKFEMLKQSLEGAFSGNVAEGGSGVLEGEATPSQAAVLDGFPQVVQPEVPAQGQAPTLLDGTPEQAIETSQLRGVEERIDDTIKDAGLSGNVETSVNERGLAIRVLTDDLLFGSGTANLQSSAATLLAPVASGVFDLPNPIRVEGHTDASPIATATFPSNWELAGARASAVVRFMARDGIAPSRLQAVGLADTRPIGDNATPGGRSQNRRVEILVLRLQGAPGQTPAEALGG